MDLLAAVRTEMPIALQAELDRHPVLAPLALLLLLLVLLVLLLVLVLVLVGGVREKKKVPGQLVHHGGCFVVALERGRLTALGAQELLLLLLLLVVVGAREASEAAAAEGVVADENARQVGRLVGERLVADGTVGRLVVECFAAGGTVGLRVCGGGFHWFWSLFRLGW